MVRRENYEFGGISLAPGERKTIDLPVSVLSDHTPVTISAHVIHGKRPGKTVFVTAGVHGDEVIGVEIVRRLLGQPALDNLRGTLIVIPIVNTYGFLIHSRYLPDRRDLNRCFPGSPRGSLAARLAHLLMEQIVKRCDFGIDLHSAAANRINLPQVRVSLDNDETLRLARVFGAPVIMTSKLREGSMRGASKDAGVDVLLYEAGEGLRFDEISVRAGVSGILRVLHDLGLIPSKGVAKARRTPLLCPTSRWLRAPQGGLVRLFKSEGDAVAKGDHLAAVSDPFGQVVEDVIAPHDGIIVGRATLPVVNEGDALFHLAAISSVDHATGTVDSLTTQLEQDPLFDEDEII
jgi:hypothetical protein